MSYLLSSFINIFQIYHYCHADGKQDTFHCPYGTIFNEYLGTCDHSGAVYCKGGEGYAGPVKAPHGPHHAHPAAHHEPYHETHEPHYYQSSPPPAQYEPSHHPGFGGGFSFPKGFPSEF